MRAPERAKRALVSTKPTRIGAKTSISFHTCVDALRAPFEERLRTFLDFLYSDVARPGVSGEKHAAVLFRHWLEFTITHDHTHGEVRTPYFRAVLALYPEPASLGRHGRRGDTLVRARAEEAMRAPFERALSGYIQRVFEPSLSPGIRSVDHAFATFLTYCDLLGRRA